ncbi:hypothetical protein MBAV_001409, partial [Candidatus Magnetobacterium bavaricum]
MKTNDTIQIELKRSGGQLGVPRLFKIDSSRLSIKDFSVLEQLIADTDFFNLPNHYPQMGNDTFEYQLTIKGTPRSHTVTFHDQDG